MKGMGGKQVVGDERKSISFVEFTRKRLHCWRLDQGLEGASI